MDNPIEAPPSGDYDALATRVSRLEGDVHDIKAMLGNLTVMMTRIDAQLPYLATKADVAALAADVTVLAADVAVTRSSLARLEIEVTTDLAKMERRLDGTDDKIAAMQTKLADVPGKTYMWAILAVLVAAYASGLAALAVLK